MNSPVVTIILATYNRVHLIEGMLNSIINQTYTNWECIIIDDNSTDDTETYLKENFLSKNKRFSFYKKDKKKHLKGLPSSRNIGIKKAKGAYILFFDDDDVVHPDLLNTCIKTFTENKDVSFVNYQKQPFIDKFDKAQFRKKINLETKTLSKNIFEQIIVKELQMASCTVMWNSDLLKNHLFNDTLMYAEEWECYSRIFILNELKGIKLNSVLYFNRKHENSNTGEFGNNDPVRVASYIKAHILVFNLVLEKNKVSNKEKKYFFNKAHVLRSKEIISKLLNESFLDKISFFVFPIKYWLFKQMKS
jgi:glycosyltransferase involved in cell wall biosynthesis